MKIHTGDTVLVIAGKDKGKQGSVMRVLAATHRVVVEGINMRTRHIKKTPQQAGQRIRYEASIAVSNVMVIDPKTKKPTRIGYAIDPKTGNKVRIARVSGEKLPTMATAKGEAKKGAKTAETTRGAAAKEAKEKPMKTEKEEAAVVAGPKKQAFWKRAFAGSTPEEQASGELRNRQDEIDKSSASTVRRSRESS